MREEDSAMVAGRTVVLYLRFVDLQDKLTRLTEESRSLLGRTKIRHRSLQFLNRLNGARLLFVVEARSDVEAEGKNLWWPQAGQ